MPHYTYCNQVIVSTVPLPALSPTTDNTTDFWFRLEEVRPQEENGPWLHEWPGLSGEKVLSYNKLGDGHLLRFPTLVDFIISHSAKHITCFPVPGTTTETIQHLFLDQVLPRCLGHQGMVMLHASAVSIPGGVVLFVGQTGEGKSTLAGYFHQSENKALSDDCVRILDEKDAVKVIPSYESLRLWPDAQQFLYPNLRETTPMAHYSSKQQIRTFNQVSNSSGSDFLDGYPIQAVMVLHKSDTSTESEIVQLDTITLREAFIEMMKQTFLLDLTDQDQYSHLMGALGRMIPRVRCYTLRLPHDYKFLPQVRQMILDELNSNQLIRP